MCVIVCLCIYMYMYIFIHIYSALLHHVDAVALPIARTIFYIYVYLYDNIYIYRHEHALLDHVDAMALSIKTYGVLINRSIETSASTSCRNLARVHPISR